MLTGLDFLVIQGDTAMRKRLLTIVVLAVLAISTGALAVPVYTYTGGYGTGTFENVKGPSGNSLYCWAASASDLLAYTGWTGWNSVTSTPITSAQDIFNVYTANFPNSDNSPLSAYSWWFTNATTDVFGNPFPNPAQNFYPGVVCNYLLGTPASVDGEVPASYAKTVDTTWFPDDVGYFVDNHFGISLSISVPGTTDGSIGPYGHDLTLWGYDPTTDQIFVTDNDDSNAGMDTYNYSTDGSGNYYIDGYTNSYTGAVNCAINELDVLELNSSDIAPSEGAGPATTVPEPATLSLLGLGLSGLIAKVAKRRNR
jgi:hypothetical protein